MYALVNFLGKQVRVCFCDRYGWLLGQLLELQNLGQQGGGPKALDLFFWTFGVSHKFYTFRD